MVAWWKRLLFSLLSVIVAAVVCLGCLVMASAIKSHPTNFRSGEVILTIGVTVGFCIIAWVFSVPVVLMVTNIRGMRFWLFWVLGGCVGPALMLVLCFLVFMAMPHSPTATWFNPALRPLVYMAAAISCMTSLFYLILLRRAQNKAAASYSPQAGLSS